MYEGQKRQCNLRRHETSCTLAPVISGYRERQSEMTHMYLDCISGRAHMILMLADVGITNVLAAPALMSAQ